MMRNQGLAANDLATAADLHRGGATLTRLGRRLGVSPKCRSTSAGGRQSGSESRSRDTPDRNAAQLPVPL